MAAANSDARSCSERQTGGHSAARTTGSLAPWNVGVAGATDMILVQLKAQRAAPPAEAKALRLLPCHANCKRLIHRREL